METTKTSVKIAKDLRKAGFTSQWIDWGPDGTYYVEIEGDTVRENGGWWAYDATAKTITAAYRKVWRQYKENQSDG